MRIDCRPAGDNAVLAVFEQRIAPEIGDQVTNLRVALDQLRQQDPSCGLRETVPAYASLLVYYDPLVLSYDETTALMAQAADAQKGENVGEAGSLIEIPVCYGGDCGPDLAFVAEHAGLSEEEVIAIHSGQDYRIYMLGFMPGFPYLGGLDPRIHTPRLTSPRTKIPAGSVGIGGEQTGIYPIASPGGWQLIGRTPLRLFDPTSGQFPYAAGDRIRFVPISAEEFAAINQNEDHESANKE